MTTQQADGRPYGDGVTEPIHPVDPAALEAAANRFEAWLAFADVSRPGKNHLGDVAYEGHPISDADLRILLVDYRHHRPTQWAYDRACEALHKQRERAEKAEAENGHLAQLVANKDESTSEIFAANLDLHERLAELKVEWSPRVGDGSFPTKAGALHAAAERYGSGPVDDSEVAWRLVGRWRDADEYQAEGDPA